MILVIAGPIGSGKSTLARALAAAIGAPYVGFGDFIRHRARNRGLNWLDRRKLQDIGQSEVESDPAAFLNSALSWANHSPDQVLVLDGLRHTRVLDALRAYGTANLEPVKLVFLSLDREGRARRVANRGMDSESLARADAHPAESDLVSSLPRVADLVLDAHRPVDDLVHEVLTLASLAKPFRSTHQSI